ncbi:hypothetical protein B0H13DRAFT_2541327 [Mycena leptocephala]|nr:hypothetical protein B0H13DRAFT_2541327 [Mycena leptocephala]
MHALEGQRLAKLSADFYSEAMVLRPQIICWKRRGHYIRAGRLCQTARNLLALCDMSGGEMDYALLNSQVGIHEDKTEYAEAYNILTEILNSTELGPYRHAITLINLAALEIRMGTVTEVVQRRSEEAKAKFKEVGYTRLLDWCDTILADLDLREGNILPAKETFQETLKSSRGKDEELVTYCLDRLGDGRHWGNQDMSTWTTVFFIHALKTKYNLPIHKALQFLADVFLGLDDHDTATSLLTLALDGFTHMDIHRSKAECMVRFAHISQTRGDCSRALEFLEAARPLFARSSQEKEIVLVDERIASITQ